MQVNSIQFRLIGLWVVILSLALFLASYGLQLLFERSLVRRMMSELTLDLTQLTGAVSVDAAGNVKLASAPRDPLFEVVYAGRYWRIARGGAVVLRSPSLWSFNLTLPPPPTGDARVTIRLQGPDEQKLIAIRQSIAVIGAADQRPLDVLVAADENELLAEQKTFATELLAGSALLAALLIVAAMSQVLIGLKPMNQLQARLAEVRLGTAPRLSGDFPIELRPLVSETNALLDAQDTALAAARTRAADLAHGLKTPLAIMATQSRALRRRGEPSIADHIDRQIEAMKRHVERHLAKVRVRGTSVTHHARVDTSGAIHRLVGALQLLPRGQELQWQLDLADNLALAVDATDFDELMGNLLENALKWAATRVRISSRLADGRVRIVVEDDGPGIAEAHLQRMLQRGERADMSVGGSGLGLAIVGDLVAAYRGTLALGKSPLGGLSATVELAARPA